MPDFKLSESTQAEPKHPQQHREREIVITSPSELQLGDLPLAGSSGRRFTPAPSLLDFCGKVQFFCACWRSFRARMTDTDAQIRAGGSPTGMHKVFGADEGPQEFISPMILFAGDESSGKEVETRGNRHCMTLSPIPAPNFSTVSPDWL